MRGLSPIFFPASLADWGLSPSGTVPALAGFNPQLTGNPTRVATLRRDLASEQVTVTCNEQRVTRSAAMITVTQLNRTTQRLVCMLLATVVVAASLSIGVFSAHSAQHEGYSVTITQLQ